MIIRPLTIMKSSPIPPSPSIDEVTIGTQTWKNGSNYYVPQFNYNSNSLSYNTSWGGSWPASIRLVKDA